MDQINHFESVNQIASHSHNSNSNRNTGQQNNVNNQNKSQKSHDHSCLRNESNFNYQFDRNSVITQDQGNVQNHSLDMVASHSNNAFQPTHHHLNNTASHLNNTASHLNNTAPNMNINSHLNTAIPVQSLSHSHTANYNPNISHNNAFDHQLQADKSSYSTAAAAQLHRRASIMSEHSFSQTELATDQDGIDLSQNNSLSTFTPFSSKRRQSISKSTSKIYALRIASQPGIYKSWAMAKTLIEGCPGAKYKGFATIGECMTFIWEGFPNCTFTVNDQGDYIMDDPEPVFQVIEEARQKKEKNSGLLMVDDLCAWDPSEQSPQQCERVGTLFQNDPLLQMTLNEEQQAIFTAVKTGKNVFISGGRKTGKDVLLSHIYNDLVSEKKSFHITSASVITSQNSSSTLTLGWIGMGKALGTKKQILSKVRKNAQVRKVWTDVSCLVIKDCSMLPAFLLDIIDFLAREIRKQPDIAFGGMQIIMIGSTYGPLPHSSQALCCPHCGQSHRLRTGLGSFGSQVGQFITCSNEDCKNMFTNSWILYPFEAAVWNDAKFSFFSLSKSYESDEKLARLLHDFGKVPPFSESALALMKELMDKHKDKEAVIICANNGEMEKINEACFSEIAGDIMKFDAVDTVLNNFDFSSRPQQKDGFSNEFVFLKKGTRLIVVKANGRDTQRGEVVDFIAPSPEQIAQFVKDGSHGMPEVERDIKEWLQRNPLLPQVRIDGTNNLEIVSCHVWIIRANSRAAAWRIQLPVRLGYALSISKAQDLLLDKIMISSSREWLVGEMFSALNLAKSFDSIYLEGLTDDSFTADSRVLDFLKTATHGSICSSVMTNNMPGGFVTAPSNFSPLKRHSVAAMGGGSQKKRRFSKQAIMHGMPSSIEENKVEGRNMQLLDPQRYQQIYQRRHSYQPLTLFQEQQHQFNFLQASHPNVIGKPQLNPMIRQIVPMGMNQEPFEMQHQVSRKPYGRSSISYEQLPVNLSMQKQKPRLMANQGNDRQSIPVIRQNVEMKSLSMNQNGRYEHPEWHHHL